MYSKTLIEAYMKAKKYTQYKQMAADLGFTTAYVASVNRGHKEFTEETATYIAQQAGLDTSEVLLELAKSRAKSDTTRAIWEQLLREYRKALRLCH
ncbi:hypothetical protein [Oceanimonas marisflavi]|uniref:hypothetical protein n=1 Tax=Oceanimonas marisflavi TaxID=2059724 RepID=UPI000D2FFFFC|nr:hypothetical protein [Oceanimonas marisflavi]